MLRWVLLLVAMLAFGFAYNADTPGLLGGAVAVGLLAAIGSGLGFIAARVNSVSQGQSQRELNMIIGTHKPGARPGPPPPAKPGTPTARQPRPPTSSGS